MILQTIFLNSGFCRTYAITREAFSWREGEGGWPIHAGAMICPVCLRLWATLSIEGEHSHELRGVSCETCQWRDEFHPVPGSLLDNDTCNGIDWGLIEALPPELLRREFDLTLKAFS